MSDNLRTHIDVRVFAIGRELKPHVGPAMLAKLDFVASRTAAVDLDSVSAAANERLLTVSWSLPLIQVKFFCFGRMIPIPILKHSEPSND